MSTPEHNLRIAGMDCAECATTLEKGVGRLTGVQSCEVNFASARMHVVGEVSNKTIHERIRQLGYDVDTSDGIFSSDKANPVSGDSFEFIRFLLKCSATTAA